MPIRQETNILRGTCSKTSYYEDVSQLCRKKCVCYMQNIEVLCPSGPAARIPSTFSAKKFAYPKAGDSCGDLAVEER